VASSFETRAKAGLREDGRFRGRVDRGDFTCVATGHSRRWKAAGAAEQAGPLSGNAGAGQGISSHGRRYGADAADGRGPWIHYVTKGIADRTQHRQGHLCLGTANSWARLGGVLHLMRGVKGPSVVPGLRTLRLRPDSSVISGLPDLLTRAWIERRAVDGGMPRGRTAIASGHTQSDGSGG